MLKILLVDDDAEFTEVACHIIEFLGHDICTAGSLKEAYEWLENTTFDHIFLDFMLPDGSGLHLIDHLKNSNHESYITLITGHPLVKGILAGLCGPKVNYIAKPLQREDLEQALSRQEKPINAPHKNKTNSRLPQKHFDCLIGESEAMQELYTIISRIALTKANVMLLGESGVGKELVAQAIHNATNVAANGEAEMVATNCGALAKDLIASELFGHEKGAFTGAIGKKDGVFLRASSGTLFLDEITEMPIDMQPNLLRVLESNKVTPLGGTKEIDVNCRVISATNRSVEEIAESKVLREDIYFRLAVFPVSIPPLRKRKEDIPLLAAAFLEELNKEYNRTYQWRAEQIQRLTDYDWPGNIRELRHAIHRAFIMSDVDATNLTLPKDFRSPFSSVSENQHSLSAGRTIEDVEKELIRVTLDDVDGNKSLAAKMLGISTKTLYNRLHSYGELED
ncbi:sigma-54 dependent transcriptional regulator [Thalassotalea sp. 1_MG-2023]|uniref:sigma-54-dependent transcriptional regulator n=1 Tax=Thalassotalea sp. 1_MG-2023 TaxID=3062680 RepID=UPI0026E12D82|nr:sigma-54 dependent transcriptional regulator [Thalassotalea sp. 1_MG-2023]MDO6427689.1 sigma-54 dependent transcriptional regulator [Thalassotalea sp. 1_MG-2023]